MKGKKDYLQTNKALWNAKVPYHVDSDFYRSEDIIQGANALVGPELALLPDIMNRRVLHLQCHFGLDSIHLARLGAQVTGIDLSDAAIAEADRISALAGTDIEFICADVYGVPALQLPPYDLVFSTYGTIGWLPDMGHWAKVVSDSLRPGGRLLLAEFHPQLWMYDDDMEQIRYSYFNTGAIVTDAQGTYAQTDADIESQEVGWNHALSEVFQALIDEGMEITHFAEYDYSPYNCFPGLVQQDAHCYRFNGREGVLPMMYTLIAQKKG